MVVVVVVVVRMEREAGAGLERHGWRRRLRLTVAGEERWRLR